MRERQLPHGDLHDGWNFYSPFCLTPLSDSPKRDYFLCNEQIMCRVVQTQNNHKYCRATLRLCGGFLYLIPTVSAREWIKMSSTMQLKYTRGHGTYPLYLSLSLSKNRDRFIPECGFFSVMAANCREDFRLRSAETSQQTEGRGPRTP